MMRKIVHMVFGSHLYGTATEKSDRDYKGVFLPDMRSVLLGRIPRALNEKTKKGDGKNTSEDTDQELYSLHYFIELACQGQTVALDMLHAPASAWTAQVSEEWLFLLENRKRFYTRSLKALIGYARRQAAKYGVKGSRLSDGKRVLEFFDKCSGDEALKQYWDYLPEGEHIHKHAATAQSNNQRLYEVCGKKFVETTHIRFHRDTLRKFVDAYGERARMAERGEGVDWKAVSHAFRAACQVRAILVDGGFEYPLKETARIVQVKTGQVPYLEAAEELEDLIDGVEVLSQKSTLPDVVDRGFWDDWLVGVMTDTTKAKP